MSFISLFSGERGFVATDQRVYSADELATVKNVIEQADLLQQNLNDQRHVVEAASTAATERGYQDGLEQGRRDASEQLALTIKQLHDSHSQELAALRQDSASLAVEIVRKIAGNTDALTWIQAQAEQASFDLVDEPTLKLRVASSQVDAMRERLAASDNTRLQIVIADDSLADNECALETANGQIDIGLETQLGAVLELFAQGDQSGESTPAQPLQSPTDLAPGL